MHASVRNAFIAFNEPLEARVHFMYLDRKGHVSTGIGNKLDAANQEPLPDTFTLEWFDKDTKVAASRAEITAEFHKVRTSGTALATLNQKEGITRLRISDPKINELVLRNLSAFEATLRGRAPSPRWTPGRQTGNWAAQHGLGNGWSVPPSGLRNRFRGPQLAHDGVGMPHVGGR